MEEPALPRPRRSQRIVPKARLDPPCSVFPDPVHPPSPPPPPTRLLHVSPHPDGSEYDYFAWRSSYRDSALSDPSFSAPVGAAGDVCSGPLEERLGAWYAYMKGFQSKIGSRVFADQHPYRRRRAAPQESRRDYAENLNSRSRRGRDGDGPFGQTEDDHLRANWYSTLSQRDDSPLRDERHDMLEDRMSMNGSDSDDSDDTCNQLRWNSRATQSFTKSAKRPPISGAESLHGDVTAEQAANGMDVQGIPWESFPFSREDYRATRMRETIRHDSSEFAEGLRDILKEPRRYAEFFDFFQNTRRIKCSIVHFQLRNLAWATSKHDVFVMHEGAVVHWDAAAKRKTQVLDLSESGTANSTALDMVQISTMIAKEDLVIAGGFCGEVVAKNLKNGVIVHNKRITYDENAITNAIDMFDSTVMTSNNDCYVRCFDVNTFQRKSAFAFDKPVNHATRQPDGKMVAVAGDGNPIQVMDGDTGERLAQLHGHEDYSFATGWHPSGRMFATGSQDRTCRVWDVRNMSQSYAVLGAHVGAVRSLRFSSCGKFLVMAESRDFVHVFDVNRGCFDTCQEIDLFGEIAGIALTPGAEGLYLAVYDRTYSSLLEYERKSSSASANMML